MPADGHIVTDLDLIVDFGALADDRVTQAAAVDGGSGADFDVVLNQHAAGLRHFYLTAGAENVSKTVLSDMAAGVNQDVVAEKRKLNRRARADVAVPADLDIGADHDPGADHRTGADFDAGSDHGKRVDNHLIFQVRGRMDHG